jgi:SAM-dependent methyltransferase
MDGKEAFVGIGRGGARLLLAEAAKRPFSGQVLQLGRQYVFFDDDSLQKFARLHDVKLKSEFVDANKRTAPLGPSYIDDGTFFARLGFRVVESCDASSDEAPTHVFDLNGKIPDELIGRYDVVYDGGTLEHVFNIPNALRNIHQLLKVGGRIIHCSPSSNYVDHGFYMFSPTLFFDYYSANNYEICEANLFEHTKKHEVDPWMIYDYLPGCIDDMSFGGFDRGNLIGISFVARKKAESTCDAVPQQGTYLRRWRDETAEQLRQKQYRGMAVTHTQVAATGSREDIGFLGKLLGKLRGGNSSRPRRSLDAYKVAEY